MEECRSTIHLLNLAKAKTPPKLIQSTNCQLYQQIGWPTSLCNKERPTGASTQCEAASLNSSISIKECYAITSCFVLFSAHFVFINLKLIHTHFKAFAPKVSMTYAFIHMGNFLLLLLWDLGLLAGIWTSRLKFGPWDWDSRGRGDEEGGEEGGGGEGENSP